MFSVKGKRRKSFPTNIKSASHNGEKVFGVGVIVDKPIYQDAYRNIFGLLQVHGIESGSDGKFAGLKSLI